MNFLTAPFTRKNFYAVLKATAQGVIGFCIVWYIGDQLYVSYRLLVAIYLTIFVLNMLERIFGE